MIWCRAVPGERFELPTNGLQNRCSTTELTRLYWGFSLSLPEFASALLAKIPLFVLSLFANPRTWLP